MNYNTIILHTKIW